MTDHPHDTEHLIRLERAILELEKQIMTSIADINNKLTKLAGDVSAFVNRPTVAVQSDLDSIGTQLDTIDNSIPPPPGLPAPTPGTGSTP